MWTKSILTKSTTLVWMEEIINRDIKVIVGGIFLGGGNPNEWDPWRESFHLFKRRARKPLFLISCIIDFMVYSNFLQSPAV